MISYHLQHHRHHHRFQESWLSHLCSARASSNQVYLMEGYGDWAGYEEPSDEFGAPSQTEECTAETAARAPSQPGECTADTPPSPNVESGDTGSQPKESTDKDSSHSCTDGGTEQEKKGQR